MASGSTRTVDRAIALLVAIRDDAPFSLADASRTTDLSAGKAVRLIRTLESDSFLRHNDWVGRTVPLYRSAVVAVFRGRVTASGYVIVSSGVESDVTAIAAPAVLRH